MAVYRFKVVFDEQDEVSREIDIKGTHTFKDFHDCILQSVGFDTKHAASLFISDDQWRAGSEFVLREEDKEKGAHGKKKSAPNRLMQQGKLVSFIEDPHQKFIYIYDYEMQWTFMIELMKIIPADPTQSYPRVSKSTGIAPKQYKQVLPPPGTEEEKSILGALALPEEDDEPTREQIVVADEGMDDEDMVRAAQMSEEGEEVEMEQAEGEDEEGETTLDESAEEL